MFPLKMGGSFRSFLYVMLVYQRVVERLSRPLPQFFFPETASEKMFPMVIGNGYGILFNLTPTKPTKPTVVSTQDK